MTIKTAWFLVGIVLYAAPAGAGTVIHEYPDHIEVEMTGEQKDKRGASREAAPAGSADSSERRERAERIAWLQGELARLSCEALEFRSSKPGDTPEDTKYRLSRREDLAREINRRREELNSLKKEQQESASGHGDDRP